jgi:electron transfer flavoprotein alpha subunit
MVEGIRVIAEKCKGCGLCKPACPFGAIEIVDKIAVITDKCVLCGACVAPCKFHAIVIERKEEAPKQDLSAYKGIWVFAEQHEGQVQSVAFELIAEGRKLAKDLNEDVSAILLGSGDLKTKAKELIEYGADKVYIVPDPHLKSYLTEPYTEVISGLIEKYKPEIFLLGATTTGRDLASRIAARIE